LSRRWLPTCLCWRRRWQIPQKHCNHFKTSLRVCHFV
jgi:hypothetical protein